MIKPTPDCHPYTPYTATTMFCCWFNARIGQSVHFLYALHPLLSIISLYLKKIHWSVKSIFCIMFVCPGHNIRFRSFCNRSNGFDVVILLRRLLAANAFPQYVCLRLLTSLIDLCLNASSCQHSVLFRKTASVMHWSSLGVADFGLSPVRWNSQFFCDLTLRKSFVTQRNYLT